MMHHSGRPGRYVDHSLHHEIMAALRQGGVAPGIENEAAREQTRRGGLNDRMARAALGSGSWDFVTLISPVAAAASGSAGGGLTRLARRLGLLAG
jgi:hypothetical protein